MNEQLIDFRVITIACQLLVNALIPSVYLNVELNYASNRCVIDSHEVF